MKKQHALTLGIALALSGTQIASATAVTVRFAAFNASLNRNASSDLLTDMANPNSVDFSVAYPDSASISGLSTAQRRVLQAHYVAETLQRINADVVLVNEFDFDFNGTPGTRSTPSALGYTSQAHQLFNNNFLNVARGGGTTGRSEVAAIDYAFGYTPTTNTGLHSGFDLDNNGVIDSTPGDGTFGNDAFGFGEFAGKFGFTIFSRFEIKAVRTFQNFLWKDMPGNLLTNDPTANNLNAFYSQAEMDAFRLSSKNHVDVMLEINGQNVHFLASHPTPPVFDGIEDRNGKRNYDEIRFWRDYINGASYIYDDQGGTGGLAPNSIFVIAGDLNADPVDGDSFKGLIGNTEYNAIGQLLNDPLVNASVTPESAGGTAAATDPSNNGSANQSHIGDPKFDTADFNDVAPGNLRVDYVLPSSNIELLNAAVFWPTHQDPNFPLVGTFRNLNLFANFPTSDHKAVYADVKIVPVPGALWLFGTALIGLAAQARRRG
ncbi:MAG: endonuclease/exonuclease/phosphatase family protein [Methylomonas sp.]|nr:endonuclease/exonuclease/phosphatase family protein [Methylomonas sp.]PPD20590.1 MAG: PEP-CTERM sorting domain-containing protein [Methylomonas sp.]PPD24537.1 MAG: PEP-CTERM sorting domain-containing protein [Methylomonas sp.]PPD33100.1 MAG: PEP-CTERM sorting domain-containing protein [Methylomonas sp.]PPD42809.1 MAG: PEP-CTERM sorting domain-containing protein [Methylomonas sp.]